MTKDRTAHVKMKTSKHENARQTHTQTAYSLLSEALNDKGQNGERRDEKPTNTQTQTQKHKDTNTKTQRQTHKQLMLYSVRHSVTKNRMAHVDMKNKHTRKHKDKHTNSLCSTQRGIK